MSTKGNCFWKIMRARRGTLAVLLVVQVMAWLPLAAQTLANQATDQTVLKQIIIFGRHSVRSSVVPDATLALFATRTYPAFEVQPGYLTPHGAQAEILLGAYFRSYLLAQGLLTGADTVDAQQVYFRANSIQRSNVTAASFATGLLPNASVPVYSYPLGQADPVFDPIAANIGVVDTQRAARETAGILNGTALPAAYSSEFALIRSVLFNYPNGTLPVPSTPIGLTDTTAGTVPLTANTGAIQTGTVINGGVFGLVNNGTDPFVMQYTDGMPMQNVAWGQLTLSDLSRQTRTITQSFNIELASPYLSQTQSSNAAAHILHSIEQTALAQQVTGAFSAPGTKVLTIISSDFYVAGLASLLNVHWMLPGYQQDFVPPGAALVFEVRQTNTGNFIVRMYYTAQTFDQLRNLTVLTASQPPATMQLFIPNGDQIGTSLDVSFGRFRQLMTNAINLRYVQDPAVETPPGILTNVPLK